MHIVDNDETLEVHESYKLNASQDPSIVKAKLFMTYDEQGKEKEFIHNSDCIRIKQIDCEGYLTCQSKDVDSLLPEEPDFLKGQIRRMYLGSKIERPKGGLYHIECQTHDKIYTE